jgi:hypothetical protein
MKTSGFSVQPSHFILSQRLYLDHWVNDTIVIEGK